MYYSKNFKAPEIPGEAMRKKAADLLNKFPVYQNDANYHWYVYKLFLPRATSDLVFYDFGMIPYFPLYATTGKDYRGRPKKVWKPKFFNYIFVLATAGQVEELRLSRKHLQPLRPHRPKYDALGNLAAINRANSHEWLTISFIEMERLIRFTEAHDMVVNITVADDDLLQKGDLVHITDGPLAGMEGILRMRQGGSGGTVFITLTSMTVTLPKGKVKTIPYLGLKSTHIPEKHFKIIAFNPSSNHCQHKIYSFENVLGKVMASYDHGVFTDQKALAKLQFLMHRYDDVRDLSRIYRTKFDTLSYLAARLLHDKVAADHYRSKIPQKDTLPRTLSRYVDEWLGKLAAL